MEGDRGYVTQSRTSWTSHPTLCVIYCKHVAPKLTIIVYNEHHASLRRLNSVQYQQEQKSEVETINFNKTLL